MLTNNIFLSSKDFDAYNFHMRQGTQFGSIRSDCSCRKLIYFQQNEVTESNQFNVAQVAMCIQKYLVQSRDFPHSKFGTNISHHF